jgi:hypothetical protein
MRRLSSGNFSGDVDIGSGGGKSVRVGLVVGKEVSIGKTVAVGGTGVKVGALVAVGGRGNVPQEASRMGKISHCSMYFFIILNFPVIFSEIDRQNLLFWPEEYQA